jgi:hypothetical protein
MEKNSLREAFDALNPTETQKARILGAVLARNTDETAALPIRRHGRALGRIIPIAASLAMLFAVATVANAATDGAVFGGLHRILFAGGGEATIEQNENGSTRSITSTEGMTKWLVRESGDALYLTLDGQELDITDALAADGYYRGEYRDADGVLHRLYVVRNAGGVNDYAERWYSQLEWLPELRFGNGIGISGPLGGAIGVAENEVYDGLQPDLDTALRARLAAYWAEYGE